MLYEEDIILHGSTIADSEGLLHAKYKSKHKSKSGKWVYVYDEGVSSARSVVDSTVSIFDNSAKKAKKAKKGANSLFDKDVNETITKTATAKDGSYSSSSDASYKALKKAVKAGRKSDKNYDRSKSTLTSLRKGGSGKNQKITARYKDVRKKGSIHKGYDATVRALKGLVK